MKRASKQPKESRQTARFEARISKLNLANKRLRSRVRQGNIDTFALIDEIHKTVNETKRQLSAPDYRLALVASGDPGVFHVSCLIKIGDYTFNAKKDFNAISVCQSLAYIGGETAAAWRRNLQIAMTFLDEAEKRSESA